MRLKKLDLGWAHRHILFLSVFFGFFFFFFLFLFFFLLFFPLFPGLRGRQAGWFLCFGVMSNFLPAPAGTSIPSDVGSHGRRCLMKGTNYVRLQSRSSKVQLGSLFLFFSYFLFFLFFVFIRFRLDEAFGVGALRVEGIDDGRMLHIGQFSPVTRCFTFVSFFSFSLEAIAERHAAQST